MSIIWLSHVLLGALTFVEPALDTVVVCPIAWQAELRPWLDYRQAQGRHCLILAPQDDPRAIRDRIVATAQRNKLRHLLLVGDVPSLSKNASPPTVTRPDVVPTFYEPSQVVVQYGSTETIASDHRYGDLDGDGLPDLAVGRLPVDTAAELKQVLARTIAYEQSLDHDGWRRRIHFVAGTSGIGALADAAIESTTKNLLRDHIPPGYTTSMTYASWQSPYCPDPERFRTTVIDRFNEGGLFWIYLGHGLPQMVDFVHVPGDRHPVFDTHATPRLNRRAAPPLALFFACYTGAIDARQDCLAEEMLKAEGGSVAVVAASRVTMPYAMSVLGLELLHEYFHGERQTLGEVIRQAKRRTIERSRDDAASRALDGMAKLLNPFGPELLAERREHLLLFNLLGDPLLQVPQVGAAKLEAESRIAAGTWLEVNGTIDDKHAQPFNGTAEIDLAVRRDRFAVEPPPRTTYPANDAERAGLQNDYQRANEPRVAKQTVVVTDGRFHARLWVPPHVQGACHVRAYLTSGTRSALGAREIEVDSAESVARTPATVSEKPPR